MGNPIKPRDDKAPQGTARIMTSANKRLRKAFKSVGQRVIALLESVPVRDVPDNEGGIFVNRSYFYMITATQMMQLSEEIAAIIEAELPADELDSFIMSSFNLGTTQAIANLANQVALPYDALTKIASPSHQARIAILQNRTFEYMQNLNADMKANLNRVLSQGMLNGDNPRGIARRIRDEIGIPEWNANDNKASYARAERIARTEIGNAHREAIRAQDKDANDLGIQTKLMWFSAFKPTTRRTHARKHGRLFTRDEVADFYSRDANQINCVCSQVSTVLDENGEPLDPDFVKRIQADGKKYQDRLRD